MHNDSSVQHVKILFLGDIPTYGKAGNRDETEDLDMEFEYKVKEDNSDEDCEIIETTGWNSIDPYATVKVDEVLPQEVQILDEEPDVSKGMGAALKVAMSKGMLVRLSFSVFSIY